MLLPHKGTGLMFGKVHPYQRAAEQQARMALERTCHECGSFNAGWGYGRPGVFQQRPCDQRWACDEPDCRDAVQAWWRATYHAERETLARAPARAPRPAAEPDLFGGVESCPSTDLGRAA